MVHHLNFLEGVQEKIYNSKYPLFLNLQMMRNEPQKDHSCTPNREREIACISSRPCISFVNPQPRTHNSVVCFSGKPLKCWQDYHSQEKHFYGTPPERVRKCQGSQNGCSHHCPIFSPQKLFRIFSVPIGKLRAN